MYTTRPSTIDIPQKRADPTTSIKLIRYLDEALAPLTQNYSVQMLMEFDQNPLVDVVALSQDWTGALRERRKLLWSYPTER
jgi:hypothetical protein